VFVKHVDFINVSNKKESGYPASSNFIWEGEKKNVVASSSR
jgi:hypothetical protein